jgi:membrane associated rhomboid family serine protease
MSSLVCFLRTTRLTNSLKNPRNLRAPSTMSNYFHPSTSPFPSTNLGLSRTRLYSNSFRPGANQVSTNMTVLYSLMGINAAVFGYAMYARSQAQQGFPQAYISFMRNFSCNLTDVVRNGAWWTTMTSTFTHVDIWHIAGNMLTTYYLGQFLCYSPLITPLRLVTIALGSGLTGSVGYLYNRYMATGGSGIDYARGLGFSGALMGITSVAACLAPTAKVLIYGIIPVPLWATVLGYGFYDGYYVNDSTSRVGHAGHLGGLAFGIAYYLLRLRGLRI